MFPLVSYTKAPPPTEVFLFFALSFSLVLSKMPYPDVPVKTVGVVTVIYGCNPTAAA